MTVKKKHANVLLNLELVNIIGVWGFELIFKGRKKSFDNFRFLFLGVGL